MPEPDANDTVLVDFESAERCPATVFEGVRIGIRTARIVPGLTVVIKDQNPPNDLIADRSTIERQITIAKRPILGRDGRSAE